MRTNKSLLMLITIANYDVKDKNATHKNITL